MRGIKFELVDPSIQVGIRNCGSDCNTTSSTMSSRIYSLWDYDGSLTRRAGTPSLLGSNHPWWRVGDDCNWNADWKLWRCDWSQPRNIGFLQASVP